MLHHPVLIMWSWPNYWGIVVFIKNQFKLWPYSDSNVRVSSEYARDAFYILVRFVIASWINMYPCIFNATYKPLTLYLTNEGIITICGNILRTQYMASLKRFNYKDHNRQRWRRMKKLNGGELWERSIQLCNQSKTKVFRPHTYLIKCTIIPRAKM